MQTYKHSGSFSMSGLLTTLGAGPLAASLLGIVYAYAAFYIPIIYLNFLYLDVQLRNDVLMRVFQGDREPATTDQK